MATYSVLDTRQIDQIARWSGLDLGNIQALEGGMANSSFSATTSAGPVVITILDNHDAASAKRLARLMDHLTDHGIPTQRVLHGVSADGVLVIDGKPVILKEYVDGRHLDPVPSNLLPTIGSLLAQVHLIDPPEFLRKNGRQLPATWQQDLGVRPPGELIDLLQHAAGLEPSLSALPSGLIHGDLFADNLLVGEDGSLTILDWETATIDPFVLDIGMTTVALCRTSNRLDTDRLELLLSGYQTQRAMTTTELEGVHAAIECANAVLMFHRFHRHNIRFPDLSKANLYRELADFGVSLATG